MNSITGRKPWSRRRMRSSVHPTTWPFSLTGIQDVKPSMVSSASMARCRRTAGSSASARPPSVKPISGSDLSATHPPLITVSWSVTTGLASAHLRDLEAHVLLAGLVDGGADVLPLLALELEVLERDDAVLGDLHRLPAEVRRQLPPSPSPAANRHGIHPLPEAVVVELLQAPRPADPAGRPDRRGTARPSRRCGSRWPSHRRRRTRSCCPSRSASTRSTTTGTWPAARAAGCPASGTGRGRRLW